jgi:hypothetical protein
MTGIAAHTRASGTGWPTPPPPAPDTEAQGTSQALCYYRTRRQMGASCVHAAAATVASASFAVASKAVRGMPTTPADDAMFRAAVRIEAQVWNRPRLRNRG